ncbi:hypothetical protein KOR34_21580 [Posidoniimonas corsicana]|uniref:Uncharacterized protein n=1 Tax=Posidoniimonas corsicana TaxID=1938618 RepID=A0A5C5VGI4_9BACT|nr:hypothetical protein [Posidoniimonas corsicana]TWT37211.1 hypothetical protein KOR34_21580 [Posidoniimonas corsicana]
MNLPLLLAQADEQATPLEQLPPTERAAVLMSLLALVLTGLALIGLTMVGARWVRRVVRERTPPRQWPQPGSPPPDRGADPPGPRSADSSDTIDARRRSDETRS